MSEDAAAAFEPHRRYLVGVAYRMLGSVAEAEDAVQDAFLRWQGVDRASVEDARAYLARVVSRLCLDRLKSARAAREQYVGTWLPDPFVEEYAPTPAAEDISVALMVTLERLSPLERAAFLLHDVFDMDYSAIAGVLDRTEAACRQLAARGRQRVHDERPRFEPSGDAETRLFGAFANAMVSGDVEAFASLLAEDAVAYTDGGGKRSAALNPIYGRERIVRFFEGAFRKGWIPFDARPARINGLPGFVGTMSDGVETIALEIDGDKIVRMYAVRNPDKLGHIA